MNTRRFHSLRQYLLSLHIFSMLCLVTACNHDVFLDKCDIPTDMYATIDGDGGEVFLVIPAARLLHIGLASLSVSQKYVSYLDSVGAVIDRSSPLENVSKIVYHTDLTHFELIKHDGTLQIRSVYNHCREEYLWPIWLEYEFGVWHINLTILPGSHRID